MTVSIKDVQVGKFFVCGYMVREIIRETDNNNVYYYNYLLDTGESINTTSSMCSKRQITRLANREASLDEIARMKRHDARKSENDFHTKLGEIALQAIPDAVLLEEVKRRGLLNDR